jgi:hypothetical protein
MLTSSTGAIAVYFAVQKYLGLEKANNTTLAQTAILPPVMFLVAGIFFVLALRPRYDNIPLEDFPAFRERRLIQLNRFIVSGTLTFLVAVAIAIVLFFFALTQ